MANESKLEKPELISTGLKSVPVSEIVENDLAPGKDVISSDSKLVPSVTKDEVDANSSIKVKTGQDSGGENGVFYPPTSNYNYCYPGSSGSYVQLDDHNLQADGSRTSVQSDNSSLVYYFPGYPYASGAVVGVDGQSVGQQSYYPSSGYLQNPLSFGWDSTYVSNVPNGNADFGNRRYGSASTTFAKANSLKAMKDGGKNAGKVPKSAYIPLNKASPLGSDLSAGHFNGYHSGGKSSSFSGQRQGHFLHGGSINYGPNGRAWNGNDTNRRDRFNKNNDFEKMTELTCGPRASNRNASFNSSDKKEDLGVLLRRDQYNQPDFKIEYTNAKFYVIKSYSEDDIHKSIKYDVWSSTPNGNKKLDAAFRDAEGMSSSQTGTKCPIFLFFSVNGSGQFVGFAEMVGQVDFDQDMDFWQVDKWHGFFPIQWHVIKDVPNSHLRHIILENNEGSPVTSSRDTQEIFLKQGLQMLTIFKNYSAKTSLLDDFNFYETREKSLRAKKSNKPASLRMEIYENGDFTNHAKADGKFEDEWRTKRTANPSSLVNLTKNLFLQG
uniref:YTH domain-containing family protein n=2 Tax=Rhizophora mucronata TaxID=61149 RepID=A0A2P2K6A3_RHIMU